MTDKKKIVLLLSGFLVLTLMFPTMSLITPTAASPDAGDNWTIPVNISVPLIDKLIGFNDRAMAVDAGANVHVAMYGDAGNVAGNNEIFYVTNMGGSWSMVNVSQVNLTFYDQNRPVIALDSNGVVHIAWAGYPPGGSLSNRDIFYSNNQGGTFSALYNITQTGSLNEKDPTMIIDSQNGVHIAFINTQNGNTTMYVYRSPSGVWSAVQEVNPGIFDLVLDDVAMVLDSNDKVHIAFIGSIGGSSYSDVFLCDNVAGSWSTPYNLTADYNTTEEINISMDIDNNNQIHLCWGGVSGSYWGAFYTSGAGTSFTTPINFNKTTFTVNDVSLVVDSSNKAHIVFSQDTGPFFRLYYINNTVGFNQAVNITSPSDDERLPHLQIDHLGYAHVVFYTDPQIIYYLKSTEAVAPPVPADFTTIIIIGAAVAVVVVIGAAAYLLKIRKPK